MAKRHGNKQDVISIIRRAQELIMAQSGIDDFYEIVRLLLVKYLSEKSNIIGLPSIKIANQLLAQEGSELSFILDNQLSLQTPPDLYEIIKELFAPINMHKQDFHALDQAFELLTSRVYKADKGQYFTPRHVIDMCVEAINPQPGEIICDPACGSGAFLKSVHSYWQNNNLKIGGLYGFDYSRRACQVASLVSYIAANSDIKIAQLDSLKLPVNLSANSNETIEKFMGKKFTGFDAIVTNPPFAGDVSADNYAVDYDIVGASGGRVERDVLFIERCIRLLKPGGRLAIVLPDNKVSGKQFRGVRTWLAKNAEIKGVVSLHRYTFLPYTSQKAAVVFAVRKPTALTVYNSQIHFFRSDAPGKTSNGSPIWLSKERNEKPYDCLDHDLKQIAKELKGAVCAI